MRVIIILPPTMAEAAAAAEKSDAIAALPSPESEVVRWFPTCDTTSIRHAWARFLLNYNEDLCLSEDDFRFHASIQRFYTDIPHAMFCATPTFRNCDPRLFSVQSIDDPYITQNPTFRDKVAVCLGLNHMSCPVIIAQLQRPSHPDDWSTSVILYGNYQAIAACIQKRKVRALIISVWTFRADGCASVCTVS